MERAAGDDVLTPSEYDLLLRATETYREELVLELGGEVGLRPAEMTRIRPRDLTRYDRDERTHYFLQVPADGGESGRDAYVPAEVAHDCRKFVNARDISPEDPILDVSPRRVQMLVAKVVDRAAASEDRLRSVSSRDLREYFTYQRLARDEIPPHVVQTIGGWKSLQSLAPYLEEPTREDVVAEFESARTRDGALRGDAYPDASHERPRRTDRLTTLVECIETLGTALLEASTREEAERAACEALADVYRCVWVCDEQRTPRAWSGLAEDGEEPLRRVVSRTPALAEFEPHDADDRVRVVRDLSTPDSDRLRGCTVAIVPLRSSETGHGLLCVAEDGGEFGRYEKALLADVGGRIGQAIQAIDRKKLLLADVGVELTFRSTDGESFFVAASTDLGCRFELEGVVPAENQSLLAFVTVTGAAVSDVLDRASTADEVRTGRLIRSHRDGALVEFVVSGPSPALTLIEQGGTVETLTVEDGTARFVGVFPTDVSVRRVVESVRETFSETDLVAKGEVEQPVQTTAGVRRVLHDWLTDKQRSTLLAAYHAGYFEWPRGSTAEELADSMDVSAPTLHNHLRKAEQKMLTAIFEQTDP